jgi:hypothetical protein
MPKTEEANADIVVALYKAFKAVESVYDKFYSPALPKAERNRLDLAWQVAHDAWRSSVHKFFDSQSANVKALKRDLASVTEKLEEDLDDLKTVAAGIDAIAGAIGIAASLATIGV